MKKTSDLFSLANFCGYLNDMSYTNLILLQENPAPALLNEVMEHKRYVHTQ